MSATQRLIQTANISTHVVTDKKAKFTCKPKFLAVLRTMPETDKNKLVFTYEEVRLLSFRKFEVNMNVCLRSLCFFLPTF